MTDPTPASAAPETTLWSGTSSQIKNFWIFVACILLVPIPWAIWRYLVVKSEKYTLTSERLLISRGVLNRTTETLELYRVRDQKVSQPFLLRIFGLENIELITTDLSTPAFVLDYIAADAKLPDLLRRQVEACRVTKRVREIDIE